MEKNKTGKPALLAGRYFKYAIGEIILVVIGILIALQINNLNEDRKNARDLKPALSALQQELQLNKSYLDGRIKSIETDLEELEYFIGVLNTPEPLKIKDTVLNNLLKQIGPTTYLPLRQNAYSILFNSGLINHIKSDSLKLKIIDIERRFQLYQRRLNDINANWEQTIKPYYLVNIDVLALRDTLYQKKVPIRYFKSNRSAFINNRNFINVLAIRSIIQNNSKRTMEGNSKKFQEIYDQINHYIEND